jgi:Dolichyl-phosphate-mannose-protein mannosyltransferase
MADDLVVQFGDNGKQNDTLPSQFIDKIGFIAAPKSDLVHSPDLRRVLRLFLPHPHAGNILHAMRLIILAAILVTVHTLTNGHYGFHRDELATIDDARHLAWGFVAYPPLTPFIARVALTLFGASLAGLRFFAALGQGLAVILAGLIARELGGKRPAQLVAAIAVAIAPLSISAGQLFQYVSFDYLWWVAVSWMTIRLLKDEDPRWFVGIGTAVGLGMMTKYTMGVLVIAMAGGFLLTPARRYLKSLWLWAGIAISVLIFLPNVVWQIQHHLISLDFLRSIHARDVRIGRTNGFLLNQLFVPACFLTIPLWVAGLYYYFFTEDGKRYRPIGWMFVISLLVFLVVQGRDYYMAPAYPMVLAAGAVVLMPRSRLVRGSIWAALALGAALGVLLLPIAPVNSAFWNTVSGKMENFREEIGWPELVDTVAVIRNSLPAEERATTGILTGNYGEAGAIDLYGPAHGLPNAISGVNSYWLRGYGDPPPQTLIVLGMSQGTLERIFDSCAIAGHTPNPYGVMNEETRDHPDIYICRRLRMPWPDFWRTFQGYG